MKRLFFILLLFTHTITAQIRRDAVWCFGDSALVDFNQTPPQLDYCATRCRGSACSIADSSGNLLFYTHTYYYPLWQTGYLRLGVVWNRNHEVMENGDSLIGDGWYKEMVIVPDPSDSLQYYLFHTDVTINGQIYYSKIDLHYNNGLGKVTQKNTLLDSLNGNKATDGLAAIKHGNGRDWWLIFRTYGGLVNDNTFYKFLITPTGISSAIHQNIGQTTWQNAMSLDFNGTGSQMVLTDAVGLIELYDFDRCTGLLSNWTTIHTETSHPQDSFIAAAFSSNDSKLYVSTNDVSMSYIYQFNLTAPNIAGSKTTIATIVFPSEGGFIKLAIDNKIYWSAFYDDGIIPYPDTVYNQYNMNLSVINQPNVLGTGCDFQPYSFYLGGHRTYWGMPNNPNYDLVAKGGSICDTLGLPNVVEENLKNNRISIYPNPASNSITFFYDTYKLATMSIRITDLTGRILLTQKLESNIVNLQSIPNGIYALSFYDGSSFLSSMKLTVLH